MAFKTPKTILTYSKGDIEAGLWCKGSLAKYGTEGEKRESEITEETLQEDYQEKDWPVRLRDKPIGCALGLVSMYAGLGEKITIIDKDGKRHKFFLPRYPGFNDGEGVKKALVALYDAIPLKDRIFGDPEPSEDEIIESIHKYNDQKTMGSKRAIKWFERALASL